MSRIFSRPAGKLCAILFMAVVGALIGAVASHHRRPDPSDPHFALPLPHHISKYPGGISLRFAMVHDVIHERFPRHGSAYYRERNRRVREVLPQEQKLAATGLPTEAYWDLVDDLAVGLERLGQHAEAIAMMRDKLAKQQELGRSGRELYSSYANLGTFLILWQLSEGFADKEKARERIRESIQLVHESIKAKPDAHFGREIWQAVIEEFLLATMDDPQLLLRYDMIGNRLDASVEPRQHRAIAEIHHWEMSARFAKRFLERSAAENERLHYRSQIARVGAEEGWGTAARTSQGDPVPFDEPALGVIGMWRYGAGANPHFALTLGEIMLRVGQRYIAWCAYERAVLTAGGIGPEEIRTGFVEHCRKRQKLIEEQLPAVEVARFRPRFQQEFAFGQAYQQAYQKYEEDRIREGASLDDPTFYEAFHAKHGPIASPVGQEDHFVTQTGDRHQVSMPLVLFLAGLGAFLMGLLICFTGSPPAKGATA